MTFKVIRRDNNLIRREMTFIQLFFRSLRFENMLLLEYRGKTLLLVELVILRNLLTHHSYMG